MFLRAREDVLGQPIELLIPESFRSAHAKQVEHYSAHGEPRRMAHDRPAVRGIRSNGEEFAAEATIARDELGGQRFLSVIVRDLTEQSRIGAEVERRWREFFETAPELELECDADLSHIRGDHDRLEHLFDRFWQADRRDRRGSGLGLSVVMGIVDAHHGKIWVDTRVGRGSTFYFTIPTGATSPPT